MIEERLQGNFKPPVRILSTKENTKHRLGRLLKVYWRENPGAKMVRTIPMTTLTAMTKITTITTTVPAEMRIKFRTRTRTPGVTWGIF